MKTKEKVLSLFKSLYIKFNSLSRKKQIALAFVAILIFIFLGKSDNNKSSKYDSSTTTGSPISSNNGNQRVADLNLALSNKELKTPYNIGGLTIKKMSAYRYFNPNYPSDNGTLKEIEWRVDIENKTNSEIQAVIDVCNSNSTAVGNTRLGHAYLADCNSINLRMNPKSISVNNTFAKSKPWFYRGDTLRICIQGKGCFEKTFVE